MMNFTDVYKMFALMIVIIGTACGLFIMWRAIANRHKKPLARILFVMGAAKLFTAFVYLEVFLGTASGAPVTPTLNVGVLLRMAIPLLLLLPTMLILELGI